MAQTQVYGTGAAELDDQKEKVPTRGSDHAGLRPGIVPQMVHGGIGGGCRSEGIWHHWLGVVRVGQGCRKRDRALYGLDCKGGSGASLTIRMPR
jgi:hypothetical protein